MQELQSRWARALRHWQTYALLAAAGFGYFVLLAASRFRPAAWGLGAVVVVGMLAVWLLPFGAAAESAEESVTEPDDSGK